MPFYRTTEIHRYFFLEYILFSFRIRSKLNCVLNKNVPCRIPANHAEPPYLLELMPVISLISRSASKPTKVVRFDLSSAEAARDRHKTIKTMRAMHVLVSSVLDPTRFGQQEPSVAIRMSLPKLQNFIQMFASPPTPINNREPINETCLVPSWTPNVSFWGCELFLGRAGL